jgi:transcriptional regulator with XRE-family HTH domain
MLAINPAIVCRNQTRDTVLENLFPGRLIELRKKKKFTQQRLAILVGVDVRSIRRWEKGERYPGPQEMQALAQALGVPIRELVTFPEHPEI